MPLHGEVHARLGPAGSPPLGDRRGLDAKELRAMNTPNGGGRDRRVFDIWLIACVWFADGVAMTLTGLYPARQLR